MNRPALILAVLLSASDAFQIPTPLVAKQPASSLELFHDGGIGGSVLLESPFQTNPFWIAEGGAMEMARNIALGVTAMVFLLAGVTFLYGAYIIPAAAEELEQECKELDPELWEEYSAKLGEGETIGTRPDLMQELGAALQPLLEAKIRAMDVEKEKGQGSSSFPSALQTTMSPFPAAPKKEVVEEVFPTIQTMSTWDDDEETKSTKK